MRGISVASLPTPSNGPERLPPRPGATRRSESAELSRTRRGLIAAPWLDTQDCSPPVTASRGTRNDARPKDNRRRDAGGTEFHPRVEEPSPRLPEGKDTPPEAMKEADDAANSARRAHAADEQAVKDAPDVDAAMMKLRVRSLD